MTNSSWQVKFWIENTLKKRPAWEGDVDDFFSAEMSISASFSKPAVTHGIPPWQLGDTILGRYKVLEIRGGPGKSGMGVVFIVLDHESGNIFAAKTLQDWCANNTRARKRFEREAKMWIELENHPNIVKAFFLEQINDRPYLFLEFVPGSDVSSRVRVGSIDMRLAIKFAIQICRAMSHAARRFPGFVHRDIKPSNCLTWQENLKLSDFGLAKAVDKVNITLMPDDAHTGEQVSTISKEGRKLGTLPYMAPELFKHDYKQDIRSDIYSFGVTFYKMITSKLPFKATTPEEWMECHLHMQPRDPLDYSPNIPIIIRDLILKCMSKDPAKRFNDFSQIGELLSSFLLKDYGEKLPRDVAQTIGIKDIVNKALSYSRLGLYKEALDQFDKVLKEDPRNVDAITGKAITLSKVGLTEEAHMMCDSAIAIDNYCPDAWIIKGRIYCNSGNYEKAISCFDKALSVRPQAADLLMEKGEILYNNGNYDEALDCFSKVVELQPASVNGWLMKGLLQLETGKYEETIKSVNQALKLEGGELAVAWACKGDAYLRMGRLSKAQKSFIKALTLEPTNSFYLVLLGCTYVRAGQNEEALHHFNRAISIDPKIENYLKTIDEYRKVKKD